jgi:hypothetical protein
MSKKYFLTLLFLGGSIVASAQLVLPAMAGVIASKPVSSSGSGVTSDLKMHLDASNSSSYTGSSTSWLDLSGNSSNGILYNGPSVGVGPTFANQNQGILSFDGSNDYINFAGGLPVTDNLTYEAWVNPSDLGGDFKVILNHDGWSTGYVHFQFGGTSLQFALNGESDKYSTFTFSTNTWYQVAAVYSKSAKTVSFYVNGTFTNTETYGNPPSVSNTGFKMGSWDGSGRFFSGKMGLIRIYHRALSSSEIQTNFNGSKTRFGL